MSRRMTIDDAEYLPAEMLVEAWARLERERIELRLRTAVRAPKRLGGLEQLAPVAAPAERFVHPQDRHVEAPGPRVPERAAAHRSGFVAEDDGHRAPVRDSGPPYVPRVEAAP